MRLRGTPQHDIVVVCTGNVCRSPYVAARLQVELPQMNVCCAGVHALTGEPPTVETLALLEMRGIVYDGAARHLTRRLIGSSRLILTATRGHRVEVTRLAKAAASRTFTLLELARLLRDADSPVGLGLEQTVNLAQQAVAMGDDSDHDDDLADPYGRLAEDYALMAERAEGALQAIVPALRLGT